jgi:ABC-type multidrug transport system ATPase subunit
MLLCTIRHFAKRFGAVTALRDVSFDVRQGEVLGLLGPNGAGKTTLLACLAGLAHADRGAVHAGERSLTVAQQRQLFFYLPDGITPWGAQSAAWLLDFAAGVMGSTSDVQAHAHTTLVSDALQTEILRVLRIGELGSQPIAALSKGQRKRLLLAMALRTPHPILLLDEPFDGLDLQLTREVIALLRHVAQSGRTLVLSIHNMQDASRVCDRLVLLDDGRTVAQGSLDELRERAGMPEAALDEVFLALAFASAPT